MVAIIAVAAFAGPTLGYGQDESLTLTAAGTVDYSCVLSLSPNSAHHPPVIIDRDNDAGNISAEEADLYASMWVRWWCQRIEDTINWGTGPTSIASTISHSGLEGPVSSPEGATVRLDGTAHFNPPTQRISSLSFDTWEPWRAHWTDAGFYIESSPFHNVTLSLPPEWEIRSAYGLLWAHSTPNACHGWVTDSHISFQLLSPHQFPRDDWPVITAVSTLTLILAAAATYRWRRKRRTLSTADEPAVPSGDPLDE